MTAATFEARGRASPFGLLLQRCGPAAVWLMMASSFFVIKEPAPCDLLFFVAAACFMTGGLTVTAAVAPLVFFSLLYNLGGFISFLEVSNEAKAVMFVLTSAYMCLTAVFFAFFVANDPVRRFGIFQNGYIVGATIASAAGLIGYMGYTSFAPEAIYGGRIESFFKDPNVFTTYLLMPIMMLIQGLLLKTMKHRLIALLALLLNLAALFLGFSRGAWVSVVLSSAMLFALNFLLTESPALRRRVTMFAIAGAALSAVFLMILLSIPSIYNLFLDRFTLVKYYDAGETGRFGNQINSIPILLTRPLGFGPTYFRKVFSFDPHNVYLNAFASYGWLGGITYPLIVISTVVVGIKAIRAKTPWQHLSIVVFCPLISTMLQGVQIDTDHWRHFYWMVGTMWGLYAASAAYQAEHGPKRA